jgi:hypothetical protein
MSLESMVEELSGKLADAGPALRELVTAARLCCLARELHADNIEALFERLDDAQCAGEAVLMRLYPERRAQPSAEEK